MLNNSLVSCNFECQLLWYKNVHYDLVVIGTENKVVYIFCDMFTLNLIFVHNAVSYFKNLVCINELTF